MRARVLAHDDTGRVCYDAPLGHGEDPNLTLARAGWRTRWVGAVRGTDGEVVLHYVVSPAPESHPYQRLAAYAVVTARVEGQRSLLLTSFAHTDRNAGLWGLPGGGVDEGEEPLAAVHREVWEETGQVITVQRPWVVDSAHWIGAAPSGRNEDFHAVRLIYVAHCPEPTPPVVHDVGGSTDQARWVPISQLNVWPPLQIWGRQVINTLLEDDPHG